MNEYISREVALKKLQMQLLDLEADQDKGEYSELCENRGARDALDGAIYDIRTLKAADVKPVKYSSWEYRTYPIVDRDGVARRCIRGYVCKACGHGEPEEKRFCGGCGAEMQNE